MTRGAHTFKVGGEYRNIESKFQFLGSTEITYNSINEFIDNRPTQVAVALDSPVFTPQQFYADRVRAGHLARRQPADARARPALRLLLGRQGEGRPAPSRSSSRRTPSPPTRTLLQLRQEQLRAAAVGRLPDHDEDGAARRLRPLLRSRPVRGSHPADRELHRAAPRPVDRRPAAVLAYPVDPSVYRNLLSVRGYTHERPDEYNVQYGVSIVAGAARRAQPDGRLHRQPRQGHVPARRRQHVRQHHPAAASARGRTGRLQDVGLRRRAGHQRQPPQRLRRSELRRAADRPDAPLPQRPLRRPPVPVLAQRGHDAGLERGGDGVEHLRLQHRVRHQPDRHPALVQRLARLHAAVQRAWSGGWRVGGIVNARSGVPINVTIAGRTPSRWAA